MKLGFSDLTYLFQDDFGQLFGPYTKMSTSYDLINYKTPNIAGTKIPSFLTVAEQTSPDPDGRKSGQRSQAWKYQIEWFEHGGDPVKSVIIVTSRNNYGGHPGESQLDQAGTKPEGF